MRQEGRDTRKRKGISVSLTPNKRQVSVPSSPSQTSQVQLHQSFVVCEQPVKVFSMRAPYKPVVKFEYSQVSKEQEMRESLALDQELYLLRKEVEKKKQTISQLRNKINTEQKPQINSIYGNRASQKINTKPFVIENAEKSKEIISSPKKNKFTEVERKPEIKTTVKKQNNEGMEKQNAMIWQRRKKQLKWAEDKMLEIIRVCDYGL